jgi:ELWxxDGT repeat protein
LDPSDLTNANGTIYFAGSLFDVNGTELWRSDGTAAGTVLTADINPGFFSSSPADLTVAGGHLFFSADDGVHGRELWDPPISPATGGFVEHDGRIVGPGLDNFVVRSGIASPPGGPAGHGVSRSARPAVLRATAAPSSARLHSPFLPATALPRWLVSPPAPSLVELGISGTDGFAGQDLIEQAIAAAGPLRRASRTGRSGEPAWDPDLIAEPASAWPFH